MFKRTRLSTGALMALGVIAALPSLAQTASQRIEVTGSNIRRAAAETASPVQTVTADDIAKSGKSSVAELLQTLSVDNQGSVPTTFGSGFASGASGISLRGLGAASTLVLINGRRIAPYGLADDGQKVFADLNVIPLEAVEKVEILTDGASAIYGSDAIAGVVNVILKKDFTGITAKASYGQSRYSDGKNITAGITAGFGNLQQQKFNVIVNFEATKKDAIYNRDRDGRGAVGRADLRDLGFDADAALGGTGAIIAGGGAAGSAINGNVRNPSTLNYFNRGNTNTAATGFTRTFSGAACSNFTSHTQGDPGGGCLIDGAQQYGQIQPSQDTLNLFTRGTVLLGNNLTGYGELNLYQGKSTSQTTPSGVSASTGYPGGPVANTAIALGAAHPDNPYFGTAARIRYLAADVGPRVSNVKSDFNRLVLGVKGSVADWDFDSAFLHSETKVSNSRTGYLQRDAVFALLNPNGRNLSTTETNAAVAARTNAAYAALPAGTYWRIAENAGLNSAAVYAALSPTISNDAKSKTDQIDVKVSGELAQLPGGALGLAAGAEYRRESVRLDPTQGTDRGNIIGLGYSAYDGARNVAAVFTELNAPVLKSLELSAALRFDRYSDSGNNVTPKLGIKYTPVKELVLRGSFGKGFRAPSPAENGVGGLAAFTTASDPTRCNLGITSACSAGNVAIITSPNPNLKPEKSTSYTLGLVLEPIAGTSISVDYFTIERKNEINQESVASAIAAGHVSRDASSALAAYPGDPGPITAVLAGYVNSNRSIVRGFDVDARTSLAMGSAGKLGLGVKWTHLNRWTRVEEDGTVLEFAGTHGNCDVTNCIGTPADRVTATVSYDLGPLRTAAAVNYRGALVNKNSRYDSDCMTHLSSGDDAPYGCRIGSFTTVDVTFRYQATKNIEVFGGIQNLFDKTPPLDPTTYGATSYNPLDYSGAVGRYFNVGLKAKF